MPFSKPVVLITEDAFEKALGDAQKYADKSERGGILVGLRRGKHVHIEHVTLPSKWDFSSRFSFTRSAEGHQPFATKQWATTNGTSDWVGEWHSHPEPIPKPSSIDLDSWRRITAFHGKPMVFLIFGFNSLWLGVMTPGNTRPKEYAMTEKGPLGLAFEPA